MAGMQIFNPNGGNLAQPSSAVYYPATGRSEGGYVFPQRQWYYFAPHTFSYPWAYWWSPTYALPYAYNQPYSPYGYGWPYYSPYYYGTRVVYR